MKKTSPTVPYRKNDLLPLVIEDVTSLGSGVGHTGEGVAVFVPGTVPGDTVLCRIIKCTKSYLVGKTEELRSPSPHRVDPGCAAAGKCGGCSLRMMDYESELALKEAFLRGGAAQGAADAAGAADPDGGKTGRLPESRCSTRLPVCRTGASASAITRRTPTGSCRRRIVHASSGAVPGAFASAAVY